MVMPPPLQGIKVLEIAGLAPRPFAGLLCADWGAEVLRVDRPRATGKEDAEPAKDLLTRRKRSIKVGLKSAAGLSLLKDIIKEVDVLIDPFRPGVLERLGLSPDTVLCKLNQRLITARMTGFRRDGKYKDMAGHDINYVAVSGVLSMLGGKASRPLPPMNLLGDFAGGGLVCFTGIVLALFERTRSGVGQVVEANMVDGAAFIASSPRLSMKTPLWGGEKGTNLLDGGSPYYDTYETADGLYMAVGAIEPQFFEVLLKGLSIDKADLPGRQTEKVSWPWLSRRFTQIFKSKTRKEWEVIFDDTDACITPVLSQKELEADGYQQRPIVTLVRSPSNAIASVEVDSSDARSGQGRGVTGEGWSAVGLLPGEDGETLLHEWLGWRYGEQYDVRNNGLVKVTAGVSSKL